MFYLINQYFIQKNMSGFVDKFDLHMNPIITEMSSLQFEKRDSALSQAQILVEMLKSLGVDDKGDYRIGLTEILSEVLPKTGAAVNSWDLEPNPADGEDMTDEIT